MKKKKPATLSRKLPPIFSLMLETRLNIATRACQNDRNKEIIRNIDILAWVVPQKSCGKEKSVNSIIMIANQMYSEGVILKFISSSFYWLFQLFSHKDL